MDKIQKYLIEELSHKCGCTLCEFESYNDDHEFWGVKFDANNKKHYIIFLNEDNFKYIDNSYCSNVNISNIDNDLIIKVLIIGTNKTFEQYLALRGNGKLIIIDKDKRKVLYSDNEILQIGDLLQNLMDSFQSDLNKDNYLATWIIIGINIAVYLLCVVLSGNPFSINIEVLNKLGAKNNELILNGEYYRLFTCMFLHGGLIHIMSNMYSLYCLGYLVERVYGKIKYVSIYLISGIISSIFSLLFSDAISVGASGAIFGVLGAVLTFGFIMRNKIGKQLLINIISVIGLNIIITMNVPNIDIFSHLGGFIGGVIVSLIIGKNTWKKAV